MTRDLSRCSLLIVAGALCAALHAPTAKAGEDFKWLGEEPRVFSVQPRPYRLGHEFQLGFGVLPTDAFYVGTVGVGSYTYHFTDLWAWEVISFAYSQNFDTALREELLETYGVEPVRGGGDRIRLFAKTNFVVKPLFGKFSVFNRKVIFGETFFTAGLGPVLKGERWRFGGTLGVGLRFHKSDVVSFRLDVRDELIFRALKPDQALFFILSISVNVSPKAEAT